MKLEHMIGVSLLLVVLALSVSCEVSIWRECRAQGHSFAYCVRMVSR